MRPTLGVHTLVTNPLSSGYLSYLAAVKTWAAVADEVVVIDGGSTDRSISVLLDWLGPLRRRVRVLTSDETTWGPGDNWSWPQIAVNREAGFRLLNTDWAVHIDADHVVEPADARLLRDELATLSDQAVLNLEIARAQNGQYIRTSRKRAWVVNKRLTHFASPAIGYGMEGPRGTGLDYPITQIAEEEFVDPWTGHLKRVSRGPAVEATGTLSVRVRRIGHFFFTRQQCLEKCKRIARAVSRYTGNAQLRTIEFIAAERLYGLTRTRSKATLIAEEPNDAIKEAIDSFYEDGMLGGALQSALASALSPVYDSLAFSARGVRFLQDHLFSRAELSGLQRRPR